MLIRTTLVTGYVPELGDWEGTNSDLIRYVHSELRENFEYIKAHLGPENQKSFFEQAYVFFNAQEVDREKDLSNPNYSNEDLYIPIILKASSSRLIARSVLSDNADTRRGSPTLHVVYNVATAELTGLLSNSKGY